MVSGHRSIRTHIHSQEEQEKLLALKVEEEREKRVNHLQQVAARRLGQMVLARGWGGWHETWASAYRRQRLLKAAGARLQRPMLAATLGHWRQDWSAAVRAAVERGHEQLLSDRDAQSTALVDAERAKVEAAREEAAAERQVCLGTLEPFDAMVMRSAAFLPRTQVRSRKYAYEVFAVAGIDGSAAGAAS